MKPSEFTQALLRWYDREGRHDLPWQQAINPYRVWVSEIMLQQTQVSTVIPYYLRFMQRFPALEDLASAEEDDVLAHWAGLGYYARGRNLHKAAQTLIRSHQGAFPTDVAELCTLPGIGRSTAGAIVSIALNGRAPILDGNVKRVLTRFHALKGWPGETKTEKALWHLAETYTPTQKVAEYTQAIMDLGATLCTRGKPRCESCPLHASCKAYQQDCVTDFPQTKKKQPLPQKQAYFLVLLNSDQEVLLQKRPPTGIWGGLWSLPQNEDSALLLADISRTFGTLSQHQELPSVQHRFSHYALELKPLCVQLEHGTGVVREDCTRWVAPPELGQLGLPAPIKQILRKAFSKA